MLGKYGKCPDVLFDEICVFKSIKFKWIIFKPYILFDNTLHLLDIKKNIIYFNKYGPGLLLYNEILCSKTFLRKININVKTYDFLE